MTTISYSFVEEFCEQFIANLPILQFFSEQYKKSYHDKCVETMQKYINQPKKQIITDIFERMEKWDIYSISVLFIQIFNSISKIFSLKDTFINKITVALSKNLHPDSNKRMT